MSALFITCCMNIQNTCGFFVVVVVVLFCLFGFGFCTFLVTNKALQILILKVRCLCGKSSDVNRYIF